ncbi:rhamnulokinase [Lacticaseibacillus daqingensis]|uniref:rhamnulokinase n=1 Tax=Lacticaseibacillus daqingensis TaxID=2486014 RepID=UPI000F770193|nr:rhamnulokinase [Lacticaseibacillus daqingensis]
MKPWVAVDIGASSGRVVLGTLVAGRLQLKEVSRFSNQFAHQAGHDRWLVDRLVDEILRGLAEVRALGYDEVTLGIDTWAVDYVLVDRQGQKLADPVCYRDARTDRAIEALTTEVPKAVLYEKTGIQFQQFNTLYQLYREDQALLADAAKIMLIPDYLGYVLTGQAVSEVTNASTTQMLNLRQSLFDSELLERLHVRPDQFAPLVDAGTVLGPIRPELVAAYGLPATTVITVATHDTASAVVGTPAAGDNWAFLSSGTWSLIGRELTAPNTGTAAFHANYTNEWGAFGTYRFLKNIAGLWMVQCLRRECAPQQDFATLAQQADQEQPFRTLLDLSDPRFVNPARMQTAIQRFARESGQPVPQTLAQLARSVYDSLALTYAAAVTELKVLVPAPLTQLWVVGGGANLQALNQVTADLTGLTVWAGPTEATALGNIAVQMMTTGAVATLTAARALIRATFPPTQFGPQRDLAATQQQYQNFLTNWRQSRDAAK